MNKYLLIYQLEQFNTTRFLKWVFKNLFRKSRASQQTIVWNKKTLSVFILSIILFIGIAITLFLTINKFIAGAIVILLIFNSYIFLILGNFITTIPEHFILDKRMKKASQKILDFPSITVIGIAGSSGKSSTQKILGKLLSGNIMETEEDKLSINEVTKMIDLKIKEDVNYFLCEMQAYKLGEIKKLSEIIKPKIAILTNINEQHLERFKKIENSILAEFEILQNLRANNSAVVNLDNALIRNNLKKAKVNKLIGITIDGNSSQLCEETLHAVNLRTESGITLFDIKIFDNTYTFSTKLLGKNNLYDVISAVACAIELGEPPEAIVEKLKDIDQIPNRLQYKLINGINYLDDTCNSNVSGFIEGLRVLSLLRGKKAIVTPGIAEIGEKSNEVHKMLGNYASKVCDLIMVIGDGDRAAAFKQGALDNNFDKSKIVRVRDINEAYKFAQKNLQQGDSVLLENDLSDQYF